MAEFCYTVINFFTYNLFSLLREAVDLMNFSEEELLVLSFINVTKLPEATQRDSLAATTNTNTNTIVTTTTTTTAEPMDTNGELIAFLKQ